MRNLIILLALSISSIANTQTISYQVIGAIGGSVSNASIDVNFTAGESVIQTATTASVILTQGFHQSSTVLVGLEELTDNTILQVYPNPAQQQLNIVQNMEKANEDFSIEIYALNGKLVFQTDVNASMNSETIQLNIANLNPGHYYIKLIYDRGTIQHTKFVKA